MEIVFFISLAVIVYVYLGYPLILAILHKVVYKPVQYLDHLPNVTLLIAAYNEKEVIREKIENSLSIDYPRDKLTIMIASDGCTDGTNEIVKEYQDKGIVLKEIIPRQGKTNALNTSIPDINDEIVVLSDANTMFYPDAIKKLVRNFGAPDVGAVTGDVKILNKDVSFGVSEGLYYKYERYIQKLESGVWSIIGVDGAMYAIKKSLFEPIPRGTILDDFVISMNIAHKGYRVLYDEEAIATENPTPNIGQEFKRKVRIVSGAFQAIKMKIGLPPLKYGRLFFEYVSHKLLRWLIVFFLMSLLISNFFILSSPSYKIFLALQVIFYLFAGIGFLLDRKKTIWIFSVPFYFMVVNIAALIGFFKGGVFDFQKVTWEKAARK